MSIGGLIVVIIVIRCLSNRSGQRTQQVQASGKSIIYQEVSFRTVFLTALYVSLYAGLIFWLYDTLDRMIPPIRISRIRDFFLVAVTGITPLLAFRAVPPWLAWRVFRPLGLPFLARFCYWFTPCAPVRELENFAALLRAVRGFTPASPVTGDENFKERLLKFFLLKRKPLPLQIDDWTIASSALAAEVRGDHDTANRLLRSFDLCPPGMRPSRILRRFAWEELAWRAAARGEWDRVGHRAGQGTGRGMPLLKILATAGMTGRVNRVGAWLAWLVSPNRLKALPFLLAAQKGCRASGQAACVQVIRESGTNPRGMHLRLLLHAAEGVPVAMEEVFALACLWDRELDVHDREKLLRRGMELGARDVLGSAGRIREGVLGELEELASVADGRIPEMPADDRDGDGSSCAVELMLRLRNRLFDEASRAEERFAVEPGSTLSDEEILEKWNIWLDLHEAASRLRRLLGDDEFSVLWYGGLGITAWNSASRIFNATGERTAWIAIIMFYWVAEMSDLLGDEEGKVVNLNNMKICGYSEPSPLLRLPRRMAGMVRKAARREGRGKKGAEAR